MDFDKSIELNKPSLNKKSNQESKSRAVTILELGESHGSNEDSYRNRDYRRIRKFSNVDQQQEFHTNSNSKINELNSLNININTNNKFSGNSG